MRRREAIGLIVGAVVWPMVTRADEKMPATPRAITNPGAKGIRGQADHHQHHDANKRLKR